MRRIEILPFEIPKLNCACLSLFFFFFFFSKNFLIRHLFLNTKISKDPREELLRKNNYSLRRTHKAGFAVFSHLVQMKHSWKKQISIFSLRATDFLNKCHVLSKKEHNRTLTLE